MKSFSEEKKCLLILALLTAPWITPISVEYGEVNGVIHFEWIFSTTIKAVFISCTLCERINIILSFDIFFVVLLLFFGKINRDLPVGLGVLANWGKAPREH